MGQRGVSESVDDQPRSGHGSISHSTGGSKRLCGMTISPSLNAASQQTLNPKSCLDLAVKRSSPGSGEEKVREQKKSKS